MDQRREFVAKALTEGSSFSSLCDDYGVSRKTGYKWLDRYKEDRLAGLMERSRRPKSNSAGICEDAFVAIFRLKSAHPKWGPKKIRELVADAVGEERTPSVSTIHRLLKKMGLVTKRRVRRPSSGRVQLKARAGHPNAVWTVDFKGWWMSKDKERCTPLTIRDEYSKYILCVQKMASTNTAAVRAVFERVFKEYGLPEVIRSDNGTPFATHTGFMGLSQLSVWWMSLGVLPDRIDPGKPYQNGGHERMHRDLKAEVQKLLDLSSNENQSALEEWRRTYNEVRPHESLGMMTPASVYVSSPRKYVPHDELEYPEDMLRRKVGKSGDIKLESTKLKISTVFAGQHLGLKPITPETFQVWMGEFPIGILDMNLRSFTTEGITTNSCLEPDPELT
jgi:transposase InsO family protein